MYHKHFIKSTYYWDIPLDYYLSFDDRKGKEGEEFVRYILEISIRCTDRNLEEWRIYSHIMHDDGYLGVPFMQRAQLVDHGGLTKPDKINNFIDMLLSKKGLSDKEIKQLRGKKSANTPPLD